jgi:hypothetical protein
MNKKILQVAAIEVLILLALVLGWQSNLIDLNLFIFGVIVASGISGWALIQVFRGDRK